MDLVLVLDTSGSMYGLTSSVVSFALGLVGQLSLGEGASRVGVIEFSDSAVTLASISSDTREVEGAIRSLSGAGGFTDISSALSLAGSLLSAGGRQCVGEECVVFLLTDG